MAFVSDQPDALSAALVLDATEVDSTNPPCGRWISVFHHHGEPLWRRKNSLGAPDGTTAKMLAELRAESVLLLAHEHRADEAECANVPLRFGAWSGVASASGLNVGERLLDAVPEFLRREPSGTPQARALFAKALHFVHQQTHLHAPTIPLGILVAAVKHALCAWASLLGEQQPRTPTTLALQRADAIVVGTLFGAIRTLRRVGLQTAEQKSQLLPLKSSRSFVAERLRYVWICADQIELPRWQSWQASTGVVVASNRTTELLVEEW